jgi:hypothetical protein
MLVDKAGCSRCKGGMLRQGLIIIESDVFCERGSVFESQIMRVLQ